MPDYNNEPVHYCKNCLSLCIKTIDNTDYCEKCGSTTIDSTQIEDWEKAYVLKYGEEFLIKNKK